jgi:Tfp pilus assembly protein PilN
VLLSAVRTETMDLLAGALQPAGIIPKRVDLNLLGWWRLLNDAGHVQTAGAQAFLILDDTCIDLVVTSAGVPLAMRSLTGLGDLPDEEVADEVAREIVYTLTSVDLERTGEHLAEIAIWHHGGGLAESLIRRLHEPFGLTAKAYALDTLPPLSEGLARRAAGTGPGLLDLAPPAWHASELRRQARTRLIALTASLLGLWALSVAVFFGGLQYQKQRLARMEARLDRVKAPAEVVRATRDRVLGLQQYVTRTHSSLECLREVSDLLPPGIELKSFTYRKGKSVELSGEADSVTLVYDFKKEMEKSPLFTATDLPRTFRTAQGREVFKITATLPGGTEP